MLPPAHDADLARLVRRGFLSIDQLDEEDEFRFSIHVLAYLTASENAHYQYRTGLFDEDRWRLYRARLQRFMRFPGVKGWWATNDYSVDFGPEFVALVSEILGEEPDRADR